MANNLTLEALTNALNQSHLSASGISFAGKGLKLNNEEDAKEIVDAINSCKELQFLNLEGNTLGIEASKSIAKALENHSEFKRALWKDLFTGRMKDEIPIALQHLGKGLVKSGALLTELDMSDNAFGPIGVKGLAALLQSSSCYALEELKLNNNGLGIGGGKLLANALLDCYNMSKKSGKPLALKVFIAGRNRLENEGAKALAKVFETIGTLEEIQMPQNGIYHPGFATLSEALKVNKELQILNFNDNTIGPVGAKHLAQALPVLSKLKVINFGDCLLKSKGAKEIASGVKSCMKLTELILDSNEIRVEAAKEIIMALEDKKDLKKIVLNSNSFGETGIEDIRNTLKSVGKFNALDTLSDDEGNSDEEEEHDEENEDVEEEEEEDDEEADAEEQEEKWSSNSAIDISHEEIEIKSVSVEEFLEAPTPEKFMALGNDRSQMLLQKVTAGNAVNFAEHSVSILMKVASITNLCKGITLDLLHKCCEDLYKEIFSWCTKHDKATLINNLFLTHLGLIKCEDKKFKIHWNIEGCLYSLEHVVTKNYFPLSLKDTLKVFLKKDVDNQKEHVNAKKKLLSLLN